MEEREYPPYIWLRLQVTLSKNYPLAAPSVRADLPAPVAVRWTSTSTLKSLLEQCEKGACVRGARRRAVDLGAMSSGPGRDEQWWTWER